MTDVSLPVVQKPAPTIRKSRSGPRRAIVLGVIQLALIAHVIHWVVTGSSVSPIEPSEGMQAVQTGLINAGAIFFAVALVSTLLLGRWFCGWGCHVVLLQDLCGWMLKKIGLRPKPFRSRLLLYAPLALGLYMFVWPLVQRWGVVPLFNNLHTRFPWVPELAGFAPWQGFNVQVTTTDFWHTFPGLAVAVPFFLICGFIVVYLLGAKGYCTYGCPYGGFFAPLEQYAAGRIRVTDACEGCGHCTAVCTSNVRVHEEVAAYGMVVDPGCMKCLDCVSVCPNDALYYGLGKPATRKGAARGATPKPKYDLTKGEEIAFALVLLGSFIAYRGVYTIVPMLMAIGMAACTTYLAWKLWRLVRDQSVNFHSLRLKYKGRLRQPGVIFATLISLVLLLTVHSGIVRTFEVIAARADGRITVPRNAIFSPAPVPLTADTLADADRAIEYYERAAWIGDGGIGLLPNRAAEPRIAWLYACKHDFAEAERRLRRYVEKTGEHEATLLDIALLMRLQLREREAAEYERTIAEAHPDFVFIIDDLARWYQAEGQIEDARALCRDTLAKLEEGSSQELFVLRIWSLLEVQSGDLEEGIALIERTIEIDDTSAAAFLALAQARVQNDQLAEAVVALERAIEIAARTPEQQAQVGELHEQAAELLKAQGRTLEASRHEVEARRHREQAQNP